MEEIVRQYDSLMGQERWKEAEALLVYCRDAAAHRGDRALELSACAELMGFYRMRSIREGFDAAWERSQELLAELDAADASRGSILIGGATGLVAFDRAEEALPVYQKAYGCYLRALRPDDYRFAALFNNLSSALIRCGRYDQAEEHMKMALDVLEKHPHHPDLGTTWVNLAQLYARMDPDGERVRACLDRAAEIFDDPEMVWDGYYAHTLQKCAGAFADFGYDAEARDLRERAALIYEGT